jgi:hypothetical protein
MKLKIEIEMDGAAFEDSPFGEAQGVLQRWFQRAQRDGGMMAGEDLPWQEWSLRDINGNRCGFARVEE